MVKFKDKMIVFNFWVCILQIKLRIFYRTKFKSGVKINFWGVKSSTLLVFRSSPIALFIFGVKLLSPSL